MELVKNPTPGIVIDAERIERNINEWNVMILGAEGTIYQGETFELQFIFNDKYPFDSPSVVFTGKNIPEHSHIYSNGHICLSILSQDWTPGKARRSLPDTHTLSLERFFLSFSAVGRRRLPLNPIDA
jgi:ubiquitin-conjugating enzyme E2 W